MVCCPDASGQHVPLWHVNARTKSRATKVLARFHHCERVPSINTNPTIAIAPAASCEYEAAEEAKHTRLLRAHTS
jgi:hypothetical protein